jgi:hypothetical protein
VLSLQAAAYARVARWCGVAAVVLAAMACATPGRETRIPADIRVVEECRDFAEQTVPSEPVRGNGQRRSTVYPSRNPDTLQTLFDLCVDAKEALK